MKSFPAFMKNPRSGKQIIEAKSLYSKKETPVFFKLFLKISES